MTVQGSYTRGIGTGPYHHHDQGRGHAGGRDLLAYRRRARACRVSLSLPATRMFDMSPKCGEVHRRQSVPMFLPCERLNLLNRSGAVLPRRSTSHETVCSSRSLAHRVGNTSACRRATLRGRGYSRQLFGDRCSPKRRPKILGNKGGYDSVAAAQKALGSVSSCKGMIERA